jgi:FMN-dependent oxidoreductase (nitrilotriacetate monooxygenase family)
MSQRLHLNINVNNSGRHPASWRVADDPLGFLSLDFYENIGRLAERGKLDAVFFSDEFDYGAPEVSRPWQALDPFFALTAIARVTRHVGLVATVSSSFNEPYNIARTVASLDQISGGRAAWNVVGTRTPEVAQLFGLDQLLDHDTRYARADEAVQVVKALWSSWKKDALVANQKTGEFADLARIEPIDFQGAHFKVRGALNVPRSPQGRPVVLQAGGSAQGMELAARHADAVFTVNHSLSAAQAFYRDIKAQAARYGRPADQILILPGLLPILGSTEQEAIQRKDWLDEVSGFDRERHALANALAIAPEDLVLDEQLPWGKIEDAAKSRAGQGFAKAVLDLAARERLTVRELLKRNPNGHRNIVGTPEQVADSIETWFRGAAADGFNLNADYFPQGLEAIVEQLVPELQRRGLFRTEYEATTLRGNLGLELPWD